MRLNLGSGGRPVINDGWVNVDRAKVPHVDVVHDLDVAPWPWADDSAEQLVAQDVFEHVADPIGFMTESHRVLQPRGQLFIKSPHFRHQDAFTDPTHRRFCTEHTWDYWIKGTVLYNDHNAAYGGVAFALERRELQNGAIYVLLRKI